jgi:hypothetical protein
MPYAFCLLSFAKFPTLYTPTSFFFVRTAQQKVCCPVVLLLSPRPPHAGQRARGEKGRIRPWSINCDAGNMTFFQFPFAILQRTRRENRTGVRGGPSALCVCFYLPPCAYARVLSRQKLFRSIPFISRPKCSHKVRRGPFASCLESLGSVS